MTTYILRNLTSLTEYTVGVFAVYDEGEAEAVTESFTTSRDRFCFVILKIFSSPSNHSCVSCIEVVPDPLDLRSSDITTESFRVSWRHPATDVILYRITWTPTDGGDSKDVCSRALLELH